MYEVIYFRGKIPQKITTHKTLKAARAAALKGLAKYKASRVNKVTARGANGVVHCHREAGKRICMSDKDAWSQKIKMWEPPRRKRTKRKRK